MQATDTGVSNKACECLSGGLACLLTLRKPSKMCATPVLLRRASPRADIQAIPNGNPVLGDVLLQSSNLDNVHVINPDAQLIPYGLHFARIALDIDHAQLRHEDITAAVQQSSAMSLYMVSAGLPARLFQR